MRNFKLSCSGTGGERPAGGNARILHFAGHALLGAAVVVVVATIIGGVVMIAWNALMPVVFHLPPLEFWQAVALLVLARILTGRLHHQSRWKCRRRWCKGAEPTDCASSDTVPPKPDTFAEWWWEEGRTAYQAYQARKDGQG